MKSQKTSFGLMAKQYQKYRRDYDSKLYKLLFTLLPTRDLKILDIGCGTGKSTEPLYIQTKKQKTSVIGIDPDEEMLKEARNSAIKKNLSIEYIKGSAESLPFKPEQFDAIISGAAFHWYGNKRTVTKIKTFLKKNGIFFIFWAQFIDSDKETIGSNLYEKYKWKGIPNKFRGQEYVCNLLSRSGFKNIKKISIPFSEKKTISEAIGNIKTNSSYALLSEDAKKAFIQEMIKAYKVALKGKKYETNKLELLVCYGKK